MPRSLAFAILLTLLEFPASAQPALGLPDAIERARRQSAAARGATAAEREVEARIAQARAGFFPRIDVAETWQRGDQPGFVFSSLLSQRRFSSDALALGTLNRPAALDNVQTRLIVEQPVFARSTAVTLRMAALARDGAAADRAIVDRDLALQVTETYGRVVAAAAGRRAAVAAEATAAASRALAANRRDAGLATDADVLQVDVHLAEVRRRMIQLEADETIARARLNALMGEPLDARFALAPLAVPAASSAAGLASLERLALDQRPDVKRAEINEALARAARASAAAAFLPEVYARATWEANGPSLTNQTTSWVAGAEVRLNVFRGFGDRARLAEARETEARRAIEREASATRARLEVREASARVEAARASIAAGHAAVAAARESLRIVRDRYESGLTDIVSLLRASEAVLHAEEAHIAAEVDAAVASASLERAVGR